MYPPQIMSDPKEYDLQPEPTPLEEDPVVEQNEDGEGGEEQNENEEEDN